MRVSYAYSGLRSASAAALVTIFRVEAGRSGRSAFRARTVRPEGSSRIATPVSSGWSAGARRSGRRRAASGVGGGGGLAAALPAGGRGPRGGGPRRGRGADEDRRRDAQEGERAGRAAGAPR